MGGGPPFQLSYEMKSLHELVGGPPSFICMTLFYKGVDPPHFIVGYGMGKI